MGTAVKISRMRLDKDKMENFFDYITKNDVNVEKVVMIGSLLKDGLTMKEALDNTNNYKFLNLKFFVNDELLKKHLEISGLSIVDFFINLG
jgi:hypothetical protein